MRDTDMRRSDELATTQNEPHQDTAAQASTTNPYILLDDIDGSLNRQSQLNLTDDAYQTYQWPQTQSDNLADLEALMPEPLVDFEPQLFLRPENSGTYTQEAIRQIEPHQNITAQASTTNPYILPHNINGPLNRQSQFNLTDDVHQTYQWLQTQSDNLIDLEALMQEPLIDFEPQIFLRLENSRTHIQEATGQIDPHLHTTAQASTTNPYILLDDIDGSLNRQSQLNLTDDAYQTYQWPQTQSDNLADLEALMPEPLVDFEPQLFLRPENSRAYTQEASAQILPDYVPTLGNGWSRSLRLESGPLQFTPSSNQSGYNSTGFDGQPSSIGTLSVSASTSHVPVGAGQATPTTGEFSEQSTLFTIPTPMHPEEELSLAHSGRENSSALLIERPQGFGTETAGDRVRSPQVIPLNLGHPVAEGASHCQTQATLGVFDNEVLAHNGSKVMFRGIQPRPAEADPSTSSALPGSGLSDATYSLLPKGKRKPNTEAGSKKIKAVRQSSACIRCRKLKESCDVNNPCGKCQATLETAKIWRSPCFRSQLDEVIAFRAGNARQAMRHSVKPKLKWDGSDPEYKGITLHYPLEQPGARQNPGLSISCRKFLPTPSDVLEEPWTLSNGDIITLTSTPYGCCDVDAGTKKLKDCLDILKPALLDEAYKKLGDDILRLGMKEAQRYASKHKARYQMPQLMTDELTIDKDSVVSLALNIRAASYFSRTRMRISGNNVLRLSYFDDSRVRENEMVPIPSVLDFQVDYMAIQYMRGQMMDVCKLLKRYFFTKESKAKWYELHLAVFVLICSLETVHTRQVEINKRFENQPLQSKVRVTGDQMIEEWQHSAKVLILHYQIISQLHVPFGVAWDKKLTNEMRQCCCLDDEALAYLKNMFALAEERGAELQRTCERDINNDSAEPLVWISRLYRAPKNN